MHKLRAIFKLKTSKVKVREGIQRKGSRKKISKYQFDQVKENKHA